MFKELKFLGYFFTIFFSILFIVKFYVSETNIRKTNMVIIHYENSLDTKLDQLPTIKSDTSDIIEYKNEVKEFLNKKSKKWWHLIK